ncbi:hypothetical protein FRB96_001672 [Tulasnella sp. 330]|nr:hypothetical protein FRB96_001672 [Tulasnella sp. 330]
MVYMIPLGSHVMIADAGAIKDISANRTSFPKPVWEYQAISAFGDNMVGSEGHEWARHRKACISSFSDRNLQLVWDSACQTMQEVFVTWSDQREIRLPVTRIWTLKIALHILSAAGFGMPTPWDDENVESEHGSSFHKALGDALDSIMFKAVLPDWAWGSASDRQNLLVTGPAGKGWLGRPIREAAVKLFNLEGYMKRILNERRASGMNKKQRDLLSNLIRANDDEEAGGLSFREVTGNLFIFLLAGHETSAHFLAFMFGLLALDQEEQERLFQHVTTVLGDRDATYGDFNALNRVLATIHESLRLYPPVPTIPKDCVVDTVVGAQAASDEGAKGSRAVKIMKGTKVSLQFAAVMHNPLYWKDPEVFDPSRFLEDPSRARDGTFLPFSTGARSCIGRRFSEVESVAIASTLIRHFKISIDNKLFKDIPGESPLERRARLLKAEKRLTLFPIDLPLVFTRR